MTLTSLKCPECSAKLSVSEDREFTFCEFCGTKIILQNENEHIIRHIDEAEIKQTEATKTIKMRELELQEKEFDIHEKSTSSKQQTAMRLGAIGLVLLIVGYAIGSTTGDTESIFYSIGSIGLLMTIPAAVILFRKENPKKEKSTTPLSIPVPTAITKFETKHYTAIETIFYNAGFTNITTIPLGDLSIGLLKKPGMVESITINERPIRVGGKKFSPDSSIVISYHSIPEKQSKQKS